MVGWEGPLGLSLPFLVVGAPLGSQGQDQEAMGGCEATLLNPCTFWAQILSRHLGNGANENWYEEFVFYQVAASSTHLH